MQPLSLGHAASQSPYSCQQALLWCVHQRLTCISASSAFPSLCKPQRELVCRLIGVPSKAWEYIGMQLKVRQEIVVRIHQVRGPRGLDGWRS